jgi:Lon protease-like protein
MNDESSPLNAFSGVVRLFPLPNLVLFPGVMQPLHVFEPRYRQMTQDALAGDRLLALVLLRPGWEADYDGRPPVHSIACVGKILAEQALEDGCFNLLLRGLSRVQIVQDIQDGRPYRSARVDLLPDVLVPSDAGVVSRSGAGDQAVPQTAQERALSQCSVRYCRLRFAVEHRGQAAVARRRSSRAPRPPPAPPPAQDHAAARGRYT